MKKAVLALIALAVLAAPVGAGAQVPGPRQTICRTSEPGVFALDTLLVRCPTARAVERYWASHEMLWPVRIPGLAGRWSEVANIEGGTMTFIDGPGGQVVYIKHRPSG